MDLGDAILKLATFVWNLGDLLTGHSLVTTQWNTTKHGTLANLYMIFLAMGLISSYDAI